MEKVEKFSIRKPRGTRDFLPLEANLRETARKEILEKANMFGFDLIETPTFESLDLFKAKSGKELLESMYIFKDKKNNSFCLVPELTAPTLRLFYENFASSSFPIKLCYFNSCYRYENPQRGRYRQFTQFGVEIYGKSILTSTIDACSFAYSIFNDLKVSSTFKIGNVNYLKGLVAHLDENVQKEILRLLDKRKYSEFRDLAKKYSLDPNTILCPKDQEINNNENLQELSNIVNTLNHMGISATLDLTIVRGLDYYSGIVFEGFDEKNNQILGGGEYDLSKEYNVKHIPAMGFGLGFDRFLLAIKNKKTIRPISCVVQSNCYSDNFKHFIELRDHIKISVVSVKNIKKYAISKNFNYALDYDTSSNTVYTLYSSKSKPQKFLTLQEVISHIK